MDLRSFFARLLWVALLLSGCAEVDPATELLVVVDSNLPESEVKHVRAEVWDRDYKALLDGTDFTLRRPQLMFPFSYSISPRDKPFEVRVVVKALGVKPGDAQNVLVERHAIVKFRPGARLLLEMYLERLCQGVQCTDELTCKRGRCESAVETPPVAGPGERGGYEPRGNVIDPASHDGGTKTMDGSASVRDGSAAGDAARPPSEASTPAQCSRNEDCQKLVASAVPAGCARAVCTSTGRCEFQAADTDGDTVTTAACTVAPGIALTLGTDCDDTNPKVQPGAWDGPALAGMANSCDGIDDDCNGTADDTKRDGKSCACDPVKDIDVPCSELDGRTIAWPSGQPVGSCRYGKKSCVNGEWTPCTGVVPPAEQDRCEGGNDDSDCDNTPNEGCECTGVNMTPCGVTRGACRQGVQRCVNGRLTSCEGAVTPQPADSCGPESDENCNGVKHEGCTCVTGEVKLCRDIRGQVGPDVTFGDCPGEQAVCRSGAWDVSACTKSCSQCDAAAMAQCANGSCEDRFNDFECVCAPGYTSSNGGHACQRDYCTPNPCGEGGLCVPGFGLAQYGCICNPATSHFDDSLGKCVRNLCPRNACENGSCRELPGDWRCSCSTGFMLDGTMKKCVPAVTPCPPGACAGGRCVPGVGTHTCDCPSGTRENRATDSCEPIDPCAGVRCGHGGECSTWSNGMVACSCPAKGTAASSDGKSCVCAPGYQECDSSVAGCESLTSNVHCGSCDNACPLSAQCVNGTCKEIVIEPVPIPLPIDPSI